MESAWIAGIYESRLWRRNPIFRLLQGISFEGERRLVERALAPGEDAVVLDVGCGPGIHTRPLARLARRGLVVGADLSRPMLRAAATHAREAALPNLAFVRADAQQLPIATGRVSAVCCCGALHLFPNPDAALAEAHRVLRPGGRLAIAAFRRRPDALSDRVTAWRRARTGMDAFLPEDLESRLRNLGFEEVRRLHARGVWLVMSAVRAASDG